MLLQKNLEWLRVNHKLSVRKLAQAIGVNPSVMSKILRGDTNSPSMETVSATAQVFKIPIDVLCTIDLEKYGNVEWATEGLNKVVEVSESEINDYLDSKIQRQPTVVYFGDTNDKFSAKIADCQSSHCSPNDLLIFSSKKISKNLVKVALISFNGHFAVRDARLELGDLVFVGGSKTVSEHEVSFWLPAVAIAAQQITL